MEPRSDAAAPELVSDIPSINQLILSDSLQIGRKDELSPGDTGVVKHASEEKDPCQTNKEFIATRIDDVNVDKELLDTARSEINQGLFKSLAKAQ